MHRAYEEVRKTNRRMWEQARAGGGPAFGISVEPWHVSACKVLAHLEAHRDGYLESSEVSPREVAWTVQNALVVVQAAEALMHDSASAIASRDRSIAANVEWILEQHPPGTKIVLGARNLHVSRARWRGLDSYGTADSRPGTSEWVFHRTGKPRLLLDLRNARHGEKTSEWLHRELKLRSIAAMALEDAFFPSRPSQTAHLDSSQTNGRRRQRRR